MHKYIDTEKITESLLKDWFGLGRLCSQNKRLENYLFNHKRALPSFPLLIPPIKKMLRKGPIGLLYIKIPEYEQSPYSNWESYEREVRLSLIHLLNIKNTYLRKNDLLAELTKNGTSIVLILSPPRTRQEFTDQNLSSVVNRIIGHLTELEKIFPFISQLIFTPIRDFFHPKQAASVAFESFLASALEEAIASSNRLDLIRREKKARSIQSFFKEKGLTTILSPIYDLKKAQVLGQRIMCLGPNDQIYPPAELFALIKRGPFYRELYSLYLKHILETLKESGYKLFFYIDPNSLHISEFSRLTKKLLSADFLYLPIVLELKAYEPHSENYFFKVARYLKGLRFELAVVNTRSPFEAWQIANSIEPDYLIVNPYLLKHFGKINKDTNFFQLLENVAMKPLSVIYEISDGSELETLHKSSTARAQIVGVPSTNKFKNRGFLTSLLFTAS